MKRFTREDLMSLMRFRAYPSLSFYLPAPREGADTRQSAVRLKNLAKRAEDILKDKGLRTSQIKELLVPIQDLVENTMAWEYQEDGLALFLHPGGMTTLQLPFPVEESVTVSDHYRIRPLIPFISEDGAFHLLTISLNETRLYDCTRRRMTERPVPGLPASLKEVLSSYDVERVLQRHSSASKGTGSGSAKGFNPVRETDKARVEEYLRDIDTAVCRLLGQGRAPLVVACVDYVFPHYKALSRYGQLMDRHVSGSPDTLKPDHMLSEAWEIVQPFFGQGRTRALAQWESIAGTSRVLEGIKHILPAAAGGRVETLFLAEGQSASGRFDPDTGKVEAAGPENQDPDHEDLFDLAAVLSFSQGGNVYLADPAELPPGANCVALLRY